MPALMSHRLIILNGEQRGERIEVGTNVLTIGSAPECRLRLDFPGCLPLHAELIPAHEGLRIKALAKTGDIFVNGILLNNSPLSHGDVVEIGSTRFFIQDTSEAVPWTVLTGQRRLRIAGALLLALLAGGLLWWSIHSRTPDTPDTPPAPVRPSAEALSNAAANAAAIIEDNMVTNTPRIRIHPSVVIAATPPDVIEALVTVTRNTSHGTESDLANSQKELDYATRFLEEKAAASNAPPEVKTAPAETAADLIQAESSLKGDAPPAVTNTEPPVTLTILPPEQASVTNGTPHP